MLVSTWKVVTATWPWLCHTTYQCYQQSNNQLPGPKGRTAWAVPIITARYALAQVTIKPLSHPHLCVNKRDEEGEFDVCQGAAGENVPGFSPTNQPS